MITNFIFYFINSNPVKITISNSPILVNELIKVFYENGIACKFIYKNFITEKLIQQIENILQKIKFNKKNKILFINKLKSIPISSPFFIVIMNDIINYTAPH